MVNARFRTLVILGGGVFLAGALALAAIPAGVRGPDPLADAEFCRAVERLASAGHGVALAEPVDYAAMLARPPCSGKP